MRIKIEIEGDQASDMLKAFVAGHSEVFEKRVDDCSDAIAAEVKRKLDIKLNEDQEAEKAWFRDAIGHKWIVMKTGETLSGEGWFVYVRRRGDVYAVKDPNGLVVKGYYKLPPLGELESRQ